MFEQSLMDRLKGLQDPEKSRALRADQHSPKNSGKPIVAVDPNGQTGVVSIYIYDVIAFPFLEAQDVAGQIPDDAREINLHINSPGGSVWEGVTIFNWLKQHQARKNVSVEGLAGSIASIIAMVGDEKPTMAESAYMMIHDPWVMLSGNSRELRKEADLLEKLEGTMADIYAEKSGQDKAEIREWMHSETWFSGPEAVEYGLAGSMEETEEAASASAQIFNLAVFNQTPEGANERKNIMDTDKNKQQPQTPEAAVKAERERVSTIHSWCKKAGCDELAEKLVTDGTSLDEAGQKIFDFMERVNPPFGAGRISVGTTEGEKWGACVRDALVMRAGYKPEKSAPGAEQFRHYSLVDIARESLERNGVREPVRSMSPSQVISKAMTGHRGMHTSDDFPQILEDGMNKILLESYRNANPTFEKWTSKATARDFKELKRYRLSEAEDLEAVGEAGEYKYSSFGETREKYQIRKYGRLFYISWESLINDDLGAFDRIARAFNGSAIRGLNSAVFNVFINNPAMADGTALFHADHNNLATSGDVGALSIITLSEARRAMRMQTGMQTSYPLNIEPKFLIVPAALETDADQIINTNVGLEADGGPGARNPLYQKLDVVTESMLDGDSETAFYLAADPQRFDTVEVAYLDGNEVPFIDEAWEFEKDAWKFKVRFCWGVKALDFKGLYKQPGA